MRITLDWDTEEERAEHFENVRDRPQQSLDGQPNPWQLRLSSSGDGYHYVEWDAAGEWGRVAGLRNAFGDDPKRLRLDRQRHDIGSPFLQVLYNTKYMERWGWDPETGNQVEQVDGTKYVSEAERIKQGGRLDYLKIARLLADDEYGTQAALADSIGVAPSTVSGWLSGDHSPSKAARKVLKRRARYYGLGHYSEQHDKSAEKLGMDVEYFDPESTADGREQRRTIVEYADAPWDWDIGGDDREYALLNVHTGTYNENHTEKQLKAVHDNVMEYVLALLSPSNPQTGQQLNLDRDTVQAPHGPDASKEVHREQDSVNWENELLDADEAAYYRANMVRENNGRSKGVSTSDAAQNPLFEVILWDEDMDGMEWHLIGVWDGESVDDATILADSEGWW